MDHQDELPRHHFQKHHFGTHLHDHAHLYVHDPLHDHGHLRRRSSIAHRAVKRVEDYARRMSAPSFNIQRIEQTLDEEIKEEDEEFQKEETEGIFDILRRSEEKILHSKKILLLIVVLNILDCALVMTELILDIHFIKDMMHAVEEVTTNFQRLLKEKYPFVFGDLKSYDIHKFYNRILSAVRLYNGKHFNSTSNNSVPIHIEGFRNVTYEIQTHYNSKRDDGEVTTYFTDQDIPYFLVPDEEHHSIEEDLSHAFHKASITILGVLVLIMLLKLFCYGSHILKRKMELFDGLVVIASFILDLVFIKGILGLPIQDSANVLTILVPWRVIRVVNSLIVAVADEAHLQLKMVYKQKKASDEHCKFVENQALYYQNMVEALRRMCNSFDIPMSTITACVSSVEKSENLERKKKTGTALGSFKRFKHCITRNQTDGRPSVAYGLGDDLSEFGQDDTPNGSIKPNSTYQSLPAITLYEVDEEGEGMEEDCKEEGESEEDKETLINGHVFTGILQEEEETKEKLLNRNSFTTLVETDV